MEKLAWLREGWEAMEAEEIRLLRQMTMAESIGQYLALQREFEPQLQATEVFFRQPRQQAIAEWQGRLSKLNLLNGAGMPDLISSLAAFQARLEAAGIPCVAVGGLAVSLWGEPRLTRDVDVKVLIGREERQRLLNLLTGYTSLHADPDAALRQNGYAFFLDPDGVRVDVMLAETSFDEAAIGRARLMEMQPGVVVRICSAEDLIIYKMVSLRAQDRADVEGVIRRQGDGLDDDYVVKWLREFEQALDDSTLVKEYQQMQRKMERG
ncbi:MAG: DUF6036 family nucleotidyltransferase [Chloroflexota bacterium]